MKLYKTDYNNYNMEDFNEKDFIIAINTYLPLIIYNSRLVLITMQSFKNSSLYDYQFIDTPICEFINDGTHTNLKSNACADYVSDIENGWLADNMGLLFRFAQQKYLPLKPECRLDEIALIMSNKMEEYTNEN